jgi:anthranilate synthase component 1
MQVQIGQRLARHYGESPLSLYRALRSLNPSPYMYYYDMGDFHIVGASPEILVRREAVEGGDKVTIRRSRAPGRAAPRPSATAPSRPS